MDLIYSHSSPSSKFFKQHTLAMNKAYPHKQSPLRQIHSLWSQQAGSSQAELPVKRQFPGATPSNYQRLIHDNSNDIIDSFAACEFKSSQQDYQLKGMEVWDGVFDENFETESLIEHNCGLEATEEKQSIRMTFAPISTTTKFVRKEININLGKKRSGNHQNVR
ncbi:hypothetical protein L5515_018550 [Caenorhabditis briggsae]|uniref:Uncharacterized protein n=1 Tax=Caenorhabditis briggsae TaxID=6238 RepID=A0AAE9FG51_CAEBR|nr:hypothetical protein L5515_018550 [Caenorhabditis briggsae]